MEQPLEVLRGVSLDIPDNDFLAIVGPSGSGKSTLLHIMGLLDRPTSGDLHFGGRNVAHLSDDELSELRGKSIGFVFQSFHLISHLSTLENVELPLFYRRVPPGRRREIARECLHRVSMDHREKHLPTQLSGGECQRVAIARSLVTHPPLILADEPTGNLDTKTGSEIFKIFTDLHAEGHTVVIITHDRGLAAAVPHRVGIMDGLIVNGGDS
ncbi:MAG: ABC transporter ATP-binding protein [Kiritimatiellia bacterium]